MASVEELCDHIALINKSRKILEGSVKDVRKQFRSDTYEFNMLYTNRQILQAFSNDMLLVEESKEDELTHIEK